MYRCGIRLDIAEKGIRDLKIVQINLQNCSAEKQRNGNYREKLRDMEDRKVPLLKEISLKSVEVFQKMR